MLRTYKDFITSLCTNYAKDPMSVFIGYNTSHGSRMYGTLEKVKKAQCIEAPVCENLMTGLAMGMSMEGYKPVLCFERHDFLPIALDAIVNHIDKLPWMSGDKFKFPIIIRAIVGSNSPLEAGPQHTNNYAEALMSMLKHTRVFVPNSEHAFEVAWNSVGKVDSGTVIIVEHKDWYNSNIPKR